MVLVPGAVALFSLPEGGVLLGISAAISSFFLCALGFAISAGVHHIDSVATHFEYIREQDKRAAP